MHNHDDVAPAPHFSAPPLDPNFLPHSSPLSSEDREKVLRFAATFLWADLEVVDEERRFFEGLAREFEIDEARASVLLESPPIPEEINPNELSAATANVIRHVALRAIACDGQVREEEMAMFELLDELMPGRRANESQESDESDWLDDVA